MKAPDHFALIRSVESSSAVEGVRVKLPRYPRPVREVHQIELTTRCNLRCRYCPSPQKLRAHEDMTWETFEAALALVAFYVQQGTQGELSLTGIGESLLHPRFVEAVARSRETIGPHRDLVVTTNGLGLTDTLCAALSPHKPKVFVSLHRPEKAGPAVEAAKRAGIFAGANPAPSISAFNWAGQVRWHVSAPRTVCEYLRLGWVVVLVDGSVTTCCLDATGAGVVGTVRDDPDTLRLAPYGLCAGCHMEVPK